MSICDIHLLQRLQTVQKYLPEGRKKCSTSNFWPDFIPPGVSKHKHCQASSQQEQQSQCCQSKKPGGEEK